MDNADRKYNCKTCDKNYSCYKSLWNHNKKFHNKIVSKTIPNVSIQNKLLCKYCSKKFSSTQNKWKHENKVCKKKTDMLTLEEMQKKIIELEDKIKITNITNKQYEEIINKLSLPVNNQLINIIEDKNKKIEELQLTNKVVLNKEVKTTETLTLNNIIIISRSEDNYINATQLCQAGGKRFNHWYSLDTTKQLINVLKSKTGIPVLDQINDTDTEAVITASGIYPLIEINKGGNDKHNQDTWIHPDLAIQLAQWISPIFALQVSSWIRTLFINGNVSIDIKLLEDKNKNNEIKIKLLEDMHLKKHKRVNYPNRNIIYMLTTEDNKKKRNYVLGKTTNLTQRLSNYNKSNEHEVIYYKECNNEEDMNIIELTILNKLKKYQEKANRDRFILPIENDISLFTNIIDKCIHNFYI